MRKWMSATEIKQLRKNLKEREELDRLHGRWLGIRDRALIEVMLGTGTRASETRSIKIGDLNIDSKSSEPFIRINTLKRRKKTIDSVTITRELSLLLKDFIRDKERYGQATNKESFLFQGRYGGELSLVGLEECIKSAFAKAGLPSHYSCHSLRHSHAAWLFFQSRNLKLVQLRLRHASVQTSGIYVGIDEEEEKTVLATLFN